MIGRASKVVLEVVAATLLGLILVVAAAAWRLSQGPVSLAFLTPDIEEALNQKGVPLRITLDDTILAWAGWERTLDVRAVGVRAFDRNGRVVASVPEMSVSISGRALLRGIVAPTRLDLFGAELRLVRSKDGAVAFAFGDAGTSPQAAVDELVAALTPGDGVRRPLDYLRRVSVVGARLAIDDRMTGTLWGAPSADIVIERQAGLLRATFGLDVDIGGRNARLDGTASWRPRQDTVRVQTHFAGLRPDLLAAKIPRLAPARALRLSFDGDVGLVVDTAGRVREGEFRVAGGKGHLVAPKLWPRPLTVERIEASGRLRRDPDLLDLDTVSLDLGGPTITGRAAMIRIGESIAVNAVAVLRDMPLARLKETWPRGLAVPTRTWIAQRMTDGRVEEARMNLSLRSGGKGIEIDSLTGRLAFRGTTVRFLDSVPPVRNVAADGVFDRNKVILTLTGGELDGLRADSGTIRFTKLDTDVEQASVEVVVRGPLRNALALIDRPALRFAARVGIDSRAATGEAAARLVVSFPLRQDLDLSRVEIAAAANLRRVSLPRVAIGQDLRDATLTLRLDKKGLEVKGTGRLGPVPVRLGWYERFAGDAPFARRYEIEGMVDAAARRTLGIETAPYVTGPVAVDVALLEQRDGSGQMAVKLGLKDAALRLPAIGWVKPAGKDGLAWLTVLLQDRRPLEIREFDVRTPDLRASGGIVLDADGRPRRLRFRRFVLGATDVAGTVTVRADGGYDVTLVGAGFDAAPFLRDDALAAGAGLPPMRVSARLERLWITTGRPIEKVSGTLAYDGTMWRRVALRAAFAPARQAMLTMVSKGTGRTFSFVSSDAGAALRAFDVFGNIKGGRMTVSAVQDRAGATAPWRGRLTITDFTLARTPVLARILSLASLTGIVNALSGKGVGFARLQMPFVYRDRALQIRNARAVGSELGLTGSGEIDLARDRWKIEGTIVPAYTINSVLGNIPVLGKLLTGAKGSGVFAATYRIAGALDKPTVTVNPLAALAPGFLRNLIDIFGKGGQGPAPDDEPPSDN